jgi:HD-like signal output (HDOD) protein
MNTDKALDTAPATPQELVGQIERLIAFPEVWVRINRLIDQERSASEIASAIEVDTDLSARLLRIVNSAFYRLATPVETISRAVTIIGTLDLRDLAMLTVARRLFTDIPADLMDLGRYWMESVGTGIYAALLGRHCRLLHPERAFVMGVIHNIGLLVICQYLPAQAREALYIAAGDHDLLPDAEREVLGYDHQQVGAALLRRWGLPASLCVVAEHHHRPEVATEFALEVAIVHVASLLAGGDSMGQEPGQVLGRAHLGAAELTRLSDDVLQRIHRDGAQQIEELTRQFDVRVG